MQKAPTSRKGGQDGDGVNVLIFVLSCVSHVLFVQDHVPEFGFICVEDNGKCIGTDFFCYSSYIANVLVMLFLCEIQCVFVYPGVLCWHCQIAFKLQSICCHNNSSEVVTTCCRNSVQNWHKVLQYWQQINHNYTCYTCPECTSHSAMNYTCYTATDNTTTCFIYSHISVATHHPGTIDGKS